MFLIWNSIRFDTENVARLQPLFKLQRTYGVWLKNHQTFITFESLVVSETNSLPYRTSDIIMILCRWPLRHVYSSCRSICIYSYTLYKSESNNDELKSIMICDFQDADTLCSRFSENAVTKKSQELRSGEFGGQKIQVER